MIPASRRMNLLYWNFCFTAHYFVLETIFLLNLVFLYIFDSYFCLQIYVIRLTGKYNLT